MEIFYNGSWFKTNQLRNINLLYIYNIFVIFFKKKTFEKKIFEKKKMGRKRGGRRKKVHTGTKAIRRLLGLGTGRKRRYRRRW